MICTLCPRMCRAQRDETHGEGYCGMGTRAVVARAAACPVRAAVAPSFSVAARWAAYTAKITKSAMKSRAVP